MTEGSNHLAHSDFDQELESTAVAGAVAVQKLIADRNNLREQLAASLRAQSELGRRLGVLHQQYVELAVKVVASMQHFDSTMRAALGSRPEVIDGSGESKTHDGNGLPMGLKLQSNGTGLPNGTARLEPQRERT
jgi:hypothetical protein